MTERPVSTGRFRVVDPHDVCCHHEEPSSTDPGRCEDYERTGQYVEGTTFLEGLVPFNGRGFLYSETADSRVGVAVWDPQRGLRR